MTTWPNTDEQDDHVHVLVTGATGYIGGRLVPELLAAGHRVRCAARTPSKLDERPWRDEVEVVRADVFDPASLDDACDEVDAVYFLVHSMDGGDDFAARDREAAGNVRDAAAGAGVRRIVYLGGMGEESDEPSHHLASRHEVGRVLADGPVPVTELRAAIIIGSGSASFEMLRHLVEVLPAMTTPRWVSTRCQPIAVRDVLAHLEDVLERDPSGSEVFEIGGPDVLTYADMMQVYAEEAGLRRRLIVPVPVLSPGLSSLWIGLVTPLPPGLARPLVESLANEVVVHDEHAPPPLDRELLPLRAAIRLALVRAQDLGVASTWRSATAWSGADPRDEDARGSHEPNPEDPRPEDPAWSGGAILTARHRTIIEASPDELFAAVGELAEGPWCEDVAEAPRLLRLRDEREGPGTTWWEFHIRTDGQRSLLEQRLRCHPLGLWGRLHWLTGTPRRRWLLARTAPELTSNAASRRA